MSDEVEFVLDTLASVVTTVESNYTLPSGDSVSVRRVDRDHSRIYDGDQSITMSTPVQTRSGDLEKGVYIGARTADPSQSAIGTEYDLDVERVVGLRVEGLSATGQNWGHIDPDGADGVPWTTVKDEIRSALYNERNYPDAGRSNTGYTNLQLANEAPQSSDYGDYYRWDVDVVFDGFETL